MLCHVKISPPLSRHRFDTRIHQCLALYCRLSLNLECVLCRALTGWILAFKICFQRNKSKPLNCIFRNKLPVDENCIKLILFLNYPSHGGLMSISLIKIFTGGPIAQWIAFSPRTQWPRGPKNFALDFSHIY